MRLPEIQGTIRRRLLINYRVDPDVMQRQLPKPFRPKLQRNYAVAGICLIQLGEIRPSALPAWMGVGSENAAHRVAVEWNDLTGKREGVYIDRRDTNSLINHWGGGRIFPGEHQQATFRTSDRNGRVELHMAAIDGAVRVDVIGHDAETFSGTSIFESLAEASAFFESGSLGYSATRAGRHLDGLILDTQSWSVAAFGVESVHSTYFENAELFPPGSIEFDHALVMRNIPHRWHSAPELAVHSADPVVQPLDHEQATAKETTRG